MFFQKKWRIPIFIFLVISILNIGCKTEPNAVLSYYRISGKTMGTTYNIQYGYSNEKNLKPAIDSLLEAINMEVSTYIKNSTISLFNQAKDTFNLHIGMREFSKGTASKNQHFFKNYLKAKVIYQRTNGYFEPTVMPLVNHWGFGYTEKKPVEKIDSIKINEIMPSVGFSKIEMINENVGNQLQLVKENPKSQIDFSGIAKGYAVDEIGRFLEKKQIKHYLAEIGGETIAKGVNSKGKIWTIGINTPKAGASYTDYSEVVVLDNRAIATSGDYRQFYNLEGSKHSHIINPKTGYSEKSDLLSVSVIANDCMTADGYATAFFILGRTKGKALAQKLDDIEALFIYGDDHGEMKIEMTDEFGKMLKKSN